MKKSLRYLKSTTVLIFLAVKMIGFVVCGISDLRVFDQYQQGVVVESGVSGLDFSMPVEILGVDEDESGYIVLTTADKAFVKSPIECSVRLVEKDNKKGVMFEKFGYCCYALGFDVLSIVDNTKAKSGQVLGSLESNKLYVKIYKNENRVSLKTIRKMFNV